MSADTVEAVAASATMALRAILAPLRHCSACGAELPYLGGRGRGRARGGGPPPPPPPPPPPAAGPAGGRRPGGGGCPPPASSVRGRTGFRALRGPGPASRSPPAAAVPA